MRSQLEEDLGGQDLASRQDEINGIIKQVMDDDEQGSNVTEEAMEESSAASTSPRLRDFATLRMPDVAPDDTDDGDIEILYFKNMKKITT